MMKGMGENQQINDVYIRWARELLGERPNEEDGLALMVLLHTHRVRLSEPILDDRPGVTELAAITQRHAAEILADSWPNRGDAQRSNRGYWYYQFNARTPYEVIEDIPQDWTLHIQRLREALARSPMVSSLDPED